MKLKARKRRQSMPLMPSANEVSLRNGAQPVDQVCHNAASFLATADKLEYESFRRYVAARAAENSAEFRRCSN